MLTVYIVSAIVAGVLILLSTLGAVHGFEHELHIDHVDSGGHDPDAAQGVWIPIFSLRFYTYLFAGFGATGLLITLLTTTNAAVAMWLAIAVGLVAGFSVSIVVRMLRISEATSGAKEADILGTEAEVLVAIKGKTPGRIRCVAKGETIDFLAICDDPDPIEIGSSVIVVAIEDGRALVMPRAVLFTDEAVKRRTS